MICIVGSDCDSVVQSDYSLFLGMPVELLGLFYYGLIGISYGIFLAVPHFTSPLLIFSVLVFSTVALLFSLYLIFIQAFVLHRWCTWCLMSAGFSAVIFIFALVGSEFGFITLLSQHHELIAVLHIISAAVGLGSATVTDVLFFKFLKDFKISEWEAGVLRVLSQIIWFALAVVVISGVGLYLPEMAELNQTPKFLVKVIAVLVIIVNGAFLNLLVTPRLVKISFGKKHHHEIGELHHTRKIAFALGATSIISWYSAFILGSLRSLVINFAPLLLIYLSLLALGIVISQLFEHLFIKRSGE